MSWASFNQTMGYMNDALQGLSDVTNKNKGGTIGSRLQAAGQNLVFNSMSTTAAADLYSHTGSYLGYAGKYQANGNGMQAMNNVFEASMFTYQLMNPWGCGCCSSSLWDMGMGGGMFPVTRGSHHPVFDNNPFFRGGWC